MNYYLEVKQHGKSWLTFAFKHQEHRDEMLKAISKDIADQNDPNLIKTYNVEEA